MVGYDKKKDDKKRQDSKDSIKFFGVIFLICAGYAIDAEATYETKLHLRRASEVDDGRAASEARLPDDVVPKPFPDYVPKCDGLCVLEKRPPEMGYPLHVPIAKIVANWNPDNTTLPVRMYETVCRFDYQTQLDLALAYRDAEVPFQLYNVPEMNGVARKWADAAYLRRKLGSTTKYKCEASNPGGEANHGANHFMYTTGRSYKGKAPPITNVRLSWDEWLVKADAARNYSIDEPNRRFYFRFSAATPADRQSGWLFRELPFFQPRRSLFVKEPSGQRGIHCRFGMDGIIAESHWDGSRNTIAQFLGKRRYILVDPDYTCDMYLLAKNHPSGRHSEVDWSKPETWDKYPKFASMPAHEVVQRTGDFLYLPTYYLHYIISLEANYQCNTRSGRDNRQLQVVNKCTPGFSNPDPAAKRGRTMQ